MWRFFVGLLLSSAFAAAHKPVILTGSREDGEDSEIGVRQIQDLEAPVPNDFRPYPEVTFEQILGAGHILQQLEKASAAAKDDSHWRLFRVLSLYTQTRTDRDLLRRVHQYARCVEGVLICDPGKSRKQFSKRTALFSGPGFEDVMAQIYDMRGKVEHLHEDQLLHAFNRDIRLDIMKKEALIEHVARTTLHRILSRTELWPHFANRSGITAFWKLPESEQARIWGDPDSPAQALADFDPRYIHDGVLGRNKEFLL